MLESTGYEAHDDARKEGVAAPDRSGRASGGRKREGWRSILVVVPSALKGAMADRVRRRGVTMNDLVLEILARRYWIPVALSGRAPGREPSREGGAIVIRVPLRIKQALAQEAHRRETNLTDLLIRILAGALNVQLELVPPSRTTPFGGGRRAA